MGSVWVYVGLVIGAFIKGAPANRSDGGLLRVEMRKRVRHFIDAFRQIVVAQFWIAAFNALCTGIFLLPLFGADLPYAGALTAFTFFAGLLPIVGNLICNGVLTLAGLSRSPEIGLLCPVFFGVYPQVQIRDQRQGRKKSDKHSCLGTVAIHVCR